MCCHNLISESQLFVSYDCLGETLLPLKKASLGDQSFINLNENHPCKQEIISKK